jgi:hypothetical protein
LEFSLTDRESHFRDGCRHMAAVVCRNDFALAADWAAIRTLRLVDGPDEVHARAIARTEFGRYRDTAP